jgi:hypothetical protein
MDLFSTNTTITLFSVPAISPYFYYPTISVIASLKLMLPIYSIHAQKRLYQFKTKLRQESVNILKTDKNENFL